MERVGPSTRSVRRTGLVLALCFALVAGAVLAVIALRSPGPAGGAGGGRADAARAAATSGISSAPPAVDVADVGLKNAGRARFQLVDRNDPTRAIGVMEWEALDPQGGGRALVTRPRATMFLSGGRVAQVRAANGLVFTPPRSDQPESGTFDGGVSVAVFEPGADGAVNLQDDEPVALLSTPRLEFNLAVGEASAAEEFRLSTPRLEVAGRGLRVVGNQVRTRLELLEIERTDYVRLAGGGGPAGRAAAGQTAAAAAEPGTTPLADPPLAAPRSYYHAVVDERVRLRREGLTVSADRLEMWGALVDNRLLPGALGAVPAGSRRPLAPGTAAAVLPRVRLAAYQPRGAAPAWGPGAGVDPRADEPPSLYTPQGDQFELTWFGPLTVRPLEDRPEELRHEEVALRLTADQTGAVAASDERAGLRGHAAWVDYGATTRTLALSGGGPKGVVLSGEGRGRLEVPALTARLGTGAVSVPGPGVLLGALDERGAGRRPAWETSARSRQISWSRSAALTLGVVDGWMTDALRSARFEGKVLAEDPRGTLSAGFAEATFAPAAAGGAPVLAGLVAGEGVAVETEEGASLRARALDVGFAASPDGGDPEPATLAATGEVSARRDRWLLSAGALQTTLARDEHGRVAVASAKAQTDVRLSGERLDMRAERVDLDVAGEHARVWGGSEPEAWASIARDGGSVSGADLTVNGAARTLVVQGPGAFTYQRDRAAGGGPEAGAGGAAGAGGSGAGAAGIDAPASPLAPALGARPSARVRVEATWQTRLAVNEDAGTVEAVGAATATSTPTSAEMDTLSAERITLAFTPAERGGGVAAGSPRRALLRAEAEGSEGSPARVDARRYAESVGNFAERTLERIMYVEGARIVASDEAAVIEVPGAGRLLVDDRRAGRGRADALLAPPAGVPAPLELTASRGTSVFSWGDGLRFDRRAGELTMSRGVRLLHRTAPGAQVASMECERLTALVRGAAAAGRPEALPVPGEQAELVSATAEGAVVVRSAEAQLVADRLAYDALRQRATAAANPENRVTFFDPARPQPVTAARLEWDMARSKVRVIEPSTVSVPGGARLPGR